MRRRELIALLASVLAWPLAARAKQGPKVWRIGVLARATHEATSANYASVVEGMRELGYVENKDFVIEWRSANGQYERFPELARELIRLKVDEIASRASAKLGSIISGLSLIGRTPCVPVVDGDGRK